MKRLKFLAFGGVLSVLSAFAWIGVAHSQRFTSIVEKDQVVNSSVYSMGSNVSIKGTVNGDVFCAGQTVTIDATVRGDIICAASDITIAGRVDGDIRVVGQTVNISADIRHNATVFASNLSLDAVARIGQDFVGMGSNLNIKGDVGRDLTLRGTETVIKGHVGRNVNATGLLTADGAKINGSVTYSSTRKIELKGDNTILGETRREEIKHTGTPGAMHFSLFWYLFVLMSTLVVGLLLAWLFPRHIKQVGSLVFGSVGKTAVAGIIASFGLLALVTLLCFTLVGLPAAALVAALAFALAIVAAPITAYAIGNLILKGNTGQMTVVLVGTMVLVTAYFIPILGYAIAIAAYLFGAGAALRVLRLVVMRARTAK